MSEISLSTIKEKLGGERVLLVGGAGFIGHNLALGLREIGVQTMVVDNLMINSIVDNVYNDPNNSFHRQAYLN